jgi:mono/diheme cytochrome c family protein
MRVVRVMSLTTAVTAGLLLAVEACTHGGAGGASQAPQPAVSAPPRNSPPPPVTAAPAASGVADISSTSGVFLADQAVRGQETYKAVCASCHFPAEHSGTAFQAAWGKRHVFDLYQAISNEMPQDKPGSLTDQQYIDLVAYLLKLNGMPAGTTPLRPDTVALKRIRIDVSGLRVP